MEKHWTNASQFLLNAQTAAGTGGNREPGDQRSRLCTKAPAVDPERYVAAMKDLLWEARGQLADIHQAQGVARQDQLRVLVDATYTSMTSLRSYGPRANRPVAQTDAGAMDCDI